MRTALLIGMIAALGTEAWGADMTIPKAPLPPTGFNWSGLYIGAHIGWAWQSSNTSTFDDNGLNNPPGSELFGGQIEQFSFKDTGFLGGAQIGYNWVIGPNWLLGAEADGSVANMATNVSVCGSEECAAYRFSTNDFGTGRARVGFFWNNVLLYGTGGWAWTDVKVDRTVTSSALIAGLAGLGSNGSNSGFNNGWVAGAGLEWGFAPRWTARIEYLHLQFPGMTNDYSYATAPPTLRTSTTVLGDDVVRVGINYLFGPR
jgi:outer membrane immunogenic protein